MRQRDNTPTPQHDDATGQRGSDATTQRRNDATTQRSANKHMHNEPISQDGATAKPRANYMRATNAECKREQRANRQITPINKHRHLTHTPCNQQTTRNAQRQIQTTSNNKHTQQTTQDTRNKQHIRIQQSTVQAIFKQHTNDITN